mgnify:CR=1 FL=1
MRTYRLKYGNAAGRDGAVGVSDMRMAVDVLEARNFERKIEVWRDETRICTVDPRGDGLWLISK